ncbi:MAG: hypothetical protein MUO24_02195 [Desulfobacterales bacterium]|nr:hypothetical protein [Desulfobacterales bacterium]
MEATSHDVDLYTIGKGILKFDRFDEDGLPTGLRDLGNAPNFSLTPTEDTLEHYSSREGVDILDWERAIKRKITGKFTLDEYDRDNLRIALFGLAGSFSINLLSAGNILGRLDFVGTNDVGPKYHVELWIIKLKPASDVNFVSGELATIDFELTCQNDEANHPDSPYGRITLIGES